MSCFPPVLCDGVDISNYIADVSESHVTDFAIRQSIQKQKEALVDSAVRKVLSEMLTKFGGRNV